MSDLLIQLKPVSGFIAFTLLVAFNAFLAFYWSFWLKGKWLSSGEPTSEEGSELAKWKHWHLSGEALLGLLVITVILSVIKASGIFS
ncbi:hypothetical protein ACI2KR_30135 [Pseudomonas luteola]